MTLVIVSVPYSPAIVWPTIVTVSPLMRTADTPSFAAKVIEPWVVAVPLSGADPVGRPASDTSWPSSSPTGS